MMARGSASLFSPTQWATSGESRWRKKPIRIHSYNSCGIADFWLVLALGSLGDGARQRLRLSLNCVCLPKTQGFPLGSSWQTRGPSVEGKSWKNLFIGFNRTEETSFRGASSTSSAGKIPRWRRLGGRLRRGRERERLGSDHSDVCLSDHSNPAGDSICFFVFVFFFFPPPPG
ncbi:hypothetical protein LZ31DRAFT_387750 [Colletotrichum somersetense]|nr:hypothetical protein LZ31DRAFT_387750 [Colletotrichum somersetense]